MNNPQTSREELQQITLAYVEGRENGTGPTLEELVERHPQYAEELIDFAMHYYLSEEIAAPPFVGISDNEPDLTYEQEALDQAFAQLDQHPVLTSLIERAGQQGLDIADLAEELDLGVDVLVMLDRRQVIAESLPIHLLEELGRLLGVTLQQLQQFFGEASLGTYPERGSFYARQAPALGEQQAFPQIIRSSWTMTQKQQAKWLALTS